jgi:hypothetical protein
MLCSFSAAWLYVPTLATSLHVTMFIDQHITTHVMSPATALQAKMPARKQGAIVTSFIADEEMRISHVPGPWQVQEQSICLAMQLVWKSQGLNIAVPQSDNAAQAVLFKFRECLLHALLVKVKSVHMPCRRHCPCKGVGERPAARAALQDCSHGHLAVIWKAQAELQRKAVAGS